MISKQVTKRYCVLEKKHVPIKCCTYCTFMTKCVGKEKEKSHATA